MNYVRHAYSSLIFFQSETGLPPAEDADDPKFLLVMRFINRHWSEHYPYGESTAEMRLMSKVDGSETFELKGSPIKEAELRQRFGSNWMDSTIDYLENTATEE